MLNWPKFNILRKILEIKNDAVPNKINKFIKQKLVILLYTILQQLKLFQNSNLFCKLQFKQLIIYLTPTKRIWL